ncbi:MAG: diacylglycerol kinase family lipid kinase [Pirellulaceae bacterium]|nr:diacylglycerol kinase family lipid kinase [Pirellulaceae bacterium]
MPELLQISPDARQVLIAANPHAGTGGRQGVVAELRRQLEDQACEVSLVTNPGALADLAAEKLAAGTLRAVVAAGGDGTFNLVLNKTPPGTPLVILPLGTENLLARHLGIAADPRQLTRIVCGGHAVRLDAAQAGERLFTLMAGCGFDADVVRRLHQNRKGNIRHLSYAKPILDSIRNYHYAELRVRYAPEGGSWGNAETISARWVFVVNLPRYAGGLSFAPDASGADGLLDVCTFKSGSLWNALLYLGSVMLGQHEGMQDFVRVRTTRLQIEADAPTPYQLDGDPGGELPVEIRSLPGRLTLLVSRDWAEREGFAAPAEAD